MRGSMREDRSSGWLRHGVSQDVRASTTRRASISERDGQSIASRPPRQISSANASSPQMSQRWIVKPHGNCPSGGMVVVRTVIPILRSGPSPDGYAGRDQCVDRCGVGGHAISTHTVTNSLRRGTFRLELFAHGGTQTVYNAAARAWEHSSAFIMESGPRNHSRAETVAGNNGRRNSTGIISCYVYRNDDEPPPRGRGSTRRAGRPLATAATQLLTTAAMTGQPMRHLRAVD
jgi:hypothetical protein